MNSPISTSRRNFIKQSLIAGSAIALPFSSLAQETSIGNKNTSPMPKIFIFSKHLQFLDYKEMCEAVKEMGFDGVDLTVRPNGHVLPERVEEDLPKATEAMRASGLTPLMFSTSAIDANNPIDVNILKTSSELGYQCYRPAWIRYTQDKEILAVVEQAKQDLKSLADLNKKLGITGSYHNHSGHFYGGAIWDLQQALADLPVQYMGCQYDIFHAHIEGGKNWEIGFRLIQPHINSLVVKDFHWGKKKGKWTTIPTPMWEGMIDFKSYFSLLKAYKINVPISIHVEYDLGGAERGNKPSIAKAEVLRRIKKDLDYVRKTWNEA